MLKAVKEVREIMDASRGVPFFPADAVHAFGCISPDHGDAAEAIIRLHAIELADGKVVLPE